MDASALARIARSAGIEAQPSACTPLGEGVKAFVHRLDFDGRDSLALKVFELPDVVDREVAGYKAAADAVPELPSLIGYAGAGPGTPHGWLLMTLASGQQLDRLIGWMPQHERLDVLREIGAFLARLHRIECPSFSLIAGAADGHTENRSFMRERIAVQIEHFEARGGNPDLAGALGRWFGARTDRLDGCGAPVLSHGDVHLENIFMDPGPQPKLRNVIDLESSQAADPVLDLARAHHNTAWIGDESLAALLDGYGAAPAWLDDVFDTYLAFFDLKLWNFFAIDPENTATESIASRLADRVGG